MSSEELSHVIHSQLQPNTHCIMLVENYTYIFAHVHISLSLPPSPSPLSPYIILYPLAPLNTYLPSSSLFSGGRNAIPATAWLKVALLTSSASTLPFNRQTTFPSRVSTSSSPLLHVHSKVFIVEYTMSCNKSCAT